MTPPYPGPPPLPAAHLPQERAIAPPSSPPRAETSAAVPVPPPVSVSRQGESPVIAPPVVERPIAAPPVVERPIAAPPVVRPSAATVPPPLPPPRAIRAATALVEAPPLSSPGLAGSPSTDPVRVYDEEEEEFDDSGERALRTAPPWLVSVVVHMGAFILLALITFRPPPEAEVFTLEMRGPAEATPLLEPLPVPLEVEEVQTEVVEEPQVAELEATLPDLPTLPEEPEATVDAVERNELVALAELPGLFDFDAPAVSSALSGRNPAQRKAMLALNGGTAKTEGAVEAGLVWLSRQQQQDGAWSLVGPYTNGSREENRVAATAMALLAFLGAGHTHQSGEYQNVVRKGIDALLEMQDESGDFTRNSALTPSHHRLYSQAQASIAICEAYGMTQDPRLLRPAQRAIDYDVQIQSPQGGWRYQPHVDGDTSVTGWFVMALQSAKMAGLHPSTDSLEQVGKFLDSVSQENGAYFGYQPQRQHSPTMTAEALLCRQYLGWKRDNSLLQQGADLLLEDKPGSGTANVYYDYYATQVLHHLGGKKWDEWNDVMRVETPAAQVRTGREKGSWQPQNDTWGRRAGRLYSTCMNLYMLEVYYRHLPIYRQDPAGR
ncbi:prenyltransferase/squalene oxidase repeat-containing protein [Lignipirellula cremea]|uniref:Squalene cyclase C-terminal domain-containing protein n=1 Tax=Lignipirellula cremea TaxID=2528010 RepID=A0A518DUT1_9BACT|nr:prenyltransferase/squalene oxidase repeat-containing protein [Lignipirellula cremea]QDU95578.1 hypothetical protein Pla8534_33940 [Lignipirellula cremea]